MEFDGAERERQIRYYVAMHYPPGMSLVWQRIARRRAERAIEVGWRYPRPEHGSA